jgi:hypothetical protein
MEGSLIIVISVIVPISSLVCCYRCFNHGELPCINQNEYSESSVVPVTITDNIHTEKTEEMSNDGDAHYI